jgi:cAMP-specific phosphodiesterase 4
LITDKQEDLDLPFLRLEDGMGQQSQPGHVVATAKNALPGLVFGPANRPESIQGPQKAGQTMSQISGVKKPLSHTNSLTKLPKHGVETPHEEELGKMLEEIDKWGLDVFQVAEYSNKHPLTTIMYTIFRVSYNFVLISHIYYI